MNQPTPYLGEKARLAVRLLNASWDGPDIVADGDGWWLAPRATTEWDALIGAPSHLRCSDRDVIGQAVDMGGFLMVDEATLADLRAVQS